MGVVEVLVDRGIRGARPSLARSPLGTVVAVAPSTWVSPPLISPRIPRKPTTPTRTAAAAADAMRSVCSSIEIAIGPIRLTRGCSGANCAVSSKETDLGTSESSGPVSRRFTRQCDQRRGFVRGGMDDDGVICCLGSGGLSVVSLRIEEGYGRRHGHTRGSGVGFCRPTRPDFRGGGRQFSVVRLDDRVW